MSKFLAVALCLVLAPAALYAGPRRGRQRTRPGGQQQEQRQPRRQGRTTQPQDRTQPTKEGQQRPTAIASLSDQCATAKPVATLALEDGGPAVEATSKLGAYAQRKMCQLLLVEIQVAESQKQAGLGGKYAGKTLTKAECGTYEEQIYVYEQQDDGSMVLVGGGTRTGNWIPKNELLAAHCDTVEGDGFQEIPAGFAAGRSYRVAFGARVGQAWRKVSAKAAWATDPPE